MQKETFPKLFVTDLDGTALGGGYQPYVRFPDPFSSFLDRLTERGCAWAINTTWGVHGQWQLVLASSLKSRPTFLMAELGLRLARYTEKGPEFIQPYTNKMEEKLKSLAEKEFSSIIRDITNNFHAKKMNFYGHWFEFMPIENEFTEFINFIEEKYSTHDSLHFRLNKHKGNKFVAYPKFLSKGKNLKEMLKIMNISPNEVVVAGDELADTSMMIPELSQYAICPGNANEKVKEHIAKTRGCVGDDHSSRGIIQAFELLAKKNNWKW